MRAEFTVLRNGSVSSCLLCGHGGGFGGGSWAEGVGGRRVLDGVVVLSWYKVVEVFLYV
jgi:hypothetical protein